jgi:hypothetical protein
VRGAVSPKPSAADYVPPCKETYVQKVVELGLIATEVKHPLLRACSSSAPRQPEQLPDYTLMYAHIGRLAILHISTRTIYLYMKEEEENVAISGIRA